MSHPAPDTTPRAGIPPPAEATEWLAALGRPLLEVVSLAGDISPRRYARVRFADGSTAILATYPADVRETCSRFLRTTELLARIDVPVPDVLASDCDAGFMLLEDLGPQTLAERAGRPWSELHLSFERARQLGKRIAGLPEDEVAGLNPPLGTELLRRELAQTWDLFLEPNGLTGDAASTAALRSLFDDLCTRLGAGPLVPCHRDFMSRNLMPLDDRVARGGVAVLDHQDLRLGPAAYDLASLLNDTLFPPPDIEAELIGDEDPVGYHRAAAQRTLKAVGTFTAFARRGSPRHLPLVRPTLRRGLMHLSRIPEYEAFAGDLARLWEPFLEGSASL